jgi:hypothetical protein
MSTKADLGAPEGAKPGEWATCCGFMGACWAFYYQEHYGACTGTCKLIDEDCYENEDGSVDCTWVHACSTHLKRYERAK